MALDNETIENLVEAYRNEEPTPENNAEVLRQLSEDFSISVNQIKIALKKSGVLVSAAPATSSTKKASSSGDKPKRRLKADALADLKAAIEAKGKDVDDDIIDKLTGKAADYFVGVLSD